MPVRNPPKSVGILCRPKAHRIGLGMKIAFFFLGLLALAAAEEHIHHPHVVKKVADKVFLEKQKAVIGLLWAVTQPVSCPKIIEIANSFHIEENVEHYNNPEVVKHFVSLYKYGTLPKEEVFTVFNEEHLKEAVTLFHVFYSAKDWETFYKTAVWARVHVNSGMFVYAFTAAVFHREDCTGIVVPAPYEIFPHLFVDSEVIQKAYHVKFAKTHATDGSHEPVVITVNNTGFYPYYQYNVEKHSPEHWLHHYEYDVNVHPEHRVSYFTEDVAVNTYHYYHHLFNPFFLNATHEYKPEGHGELFFYYHQQLLARYFLERLSNDLLEIDTVSFGAPIKYGYNPNLRYPNGQAFPVRPDNVVVHEHTSHDAHVVDDFVRRIVDAIDLGFVITKAGEKVSIFTPTGLDHIGHLIEGTAHSVNPAFYGKLYYYGVKVFGHIVDAHYNHDVAPSVLEHYETALRDPLYYRVVAFLTELYHRYKHHLGSYHYEELAFPGVKVNSVEVDKLVTYFENFEFDISSAVASGKIAEDLVVKARQFRLNHKPFTYKVNVVSDKDTKVMVRVFIGPKYDVEGHVYDVNEKRKLMVEIDRFPHEVHVGENVISRNSHEIFSTVEDHVSIHDLHKKVVEALEGTTEFNFEEVDRHCGFPTRFVLPKGKRGGLPVTFFVAVTPVTGDVNAASFDPKYHSTVGCGTGLGLFPQDGYAMGFPFDRPVDVTQFFVPNFYEKEVVVFHKRADEAANASV